MKVSISLRTRFHLIRFFARLYGIWPAENDRKNHLLRNLLWWFYITNSTSIFILTIPAIQANHKDLYIVSRSIIELILASEIILILLYTHNQRFRLRSLLTHAELKLLAVPPFSYFLDHANFYTLMYVCEVLGHLIVAIAYGCTEKPEPVYHGLLLTAKYPFEVANPRLPLTLLQALFLAHGFVITSFDGIAVLLIYICTGCLKSLEFDLSRVGNNYAELTDWVRVHDQIISLINETNKILRFMILKSVVSFMLYAFGVGLLILNPKTSTSWLYELTLVLLVFAKLYFYAESAQNMINATEDLRMAIYSTSWYNQNIKMVKAKVLVIQRCQKASSISVNGFMSSFDKQYLNKVIYATVSYFITIRAVIGSRY